MGEVKVRSSFTSRGWMSFGSWTQEINKYSLGQINLGNNPLTKLEVASCINIFNYARFSWWYDSPYADKKYNPKVYLGTIQNVSTSWLYDKQTDQSNDLPSLPEGLQKSGSLII